MFYKQHVLLAVCGCSLLLSNGLHAIPTLTPDQLADAEQQARFQAQIAIETKKQIQILDPKNPYVETTKELGAAVVVNSTTHAVSRVFDDVWASIVRAIRGESLEEKEHRLQLEAMEVNNERMLAENRNLALTGYKAVYDIMIQEETNPVEKAALKKKFNETLQKIAQLQENKLLQEAKLKQ